MAGKNDDRFLTLLTVAVLGRFLLYLIPSVKPIIPIIAFTALTLGLEQGILMGLATWFLTNLVIDSFSGYGFGDWTWHQMIGGALAAYVATLVVSKKGKDEVTAMDLINATIAGTVVFELAVNIGGAGGFDLGYFANSLPCSIAHLAGNLLFAVILAGFLPKGKGD